MPCPPQEDRFTFWLGENRATPSLNIVTVDVVQGKTSIGDTVQGKKPGASFGLNRLCRFDRDGSSSRTCI
jgi:hypothetical protein